MGPIKIVYSYVQEDEELLRELEKHLDGMKRSKLITTWLDQLPRTGIDGAQEVKKHLENADIVLPLVSGHFLDSESSWGFEMKRVLERYDAGEVSVIPILLSPVNWEATPFKHLPILPHGGRAVIEWQERDEAFLNIAEGIKEAATAISISSLTKNKLATSHQDQPVEDTILKGPTAPWNREYRLLASREIAKRLNLRKEHSHPTVLLLGSKSGGLFRSERFYDILQPFSQRSFSGLSQVEQFRSCYALLTEGQFSEIDVHAILRIALRDLTVTGADISLAELVKRGYFDEIITTNIDDILEQALSQVGLREVRDFETVVAGLMKQDSFNIERSSPVRITKVFGDFNARDYSINRSSFSDTQKFLQYTPVRDILVIGIDPLWDKELLRAIPEGTGNIWFINEEALMEEPYVSKLLQNRPTQLLLGREGSYEQFITALYSDLFGFPPHSQLLGDLYQQLQTLQREFEHLQNEIKELKSENEYLRNLIESNGGTSSHTHQEC